MLVGLADGGEGRRFPGRGGRTAGDEEPFGRGCGVGDGGCGVGDGGCGGGDEVVVDHASELRGKVQESEGLLLLGWEDGLWALGDLTLS